jgi:hypothetical protein
LPLPPSRSSIKLERRNRCSVVVTLAWLFCVCTIMISLCVRCRKERVSLFDLTNLTFELYIHRHHVLQNLPVQKIKKLTNFSNFAFYKKGSWKVSLFVGYRFSHEGDNKPHLKFYMKKRVLVVYRAMPRMLDIFWWTTDFGAIGISCCFRALCGVQRRMQHRNTSNLISFDRYTFQLAPCGIWRWVIHLGFEMQSDSSQKFTNGKS